MTARLPIVVYCLFALACGKDAPVLQPAAPTPIAKTYAVSGVIVERASRQAVPGITVRLFAVAGSRLLGAAATDGGGNYTISGVPAGDVQLDLDASGYVHTYALHTIAGDVRLDGSIARRQVEYRVTGTARHCAATYANSSGGTSQQGVALPFSYGWVSPREGAFLYMSCQIDQSTDAGSIRVDLYTDGALVKSATAVGFPTIATVSGSY